MKCGRRWEDNHNNGKEIILKLNAEKYLMTFFRYTIGGERESKKNSISMFPNPAQIIAGHLLKV
jgi:hypothetical protein